MMYATANVNVPIIASYEAILNIFDFFFHSIYIIIFITLNIT